MSSYVRIAAICGFALTIGCAAVDKWNEGAAKQRDELAALNRQKALTSIELVHQKLRPTPSGVLKAPKGTSEDLLKERVAQYCNSKSFPAWDIVEIKAVKEYQGNKGGALINCTGPSCFGANRSKAVYDAFDEVQFECKGS